MQFALPADLDSWQQRVRQFVREELQPHDATIEASGEVPEAAMAGLRRMGLFGTNTPTAYGGLGLSMLGSCLAIEEIAKAHTAFYYLSGVNVHIGSKPIEFEGSEALKRRWLPELASGRTIGAFALTEADAGSDAARLKTEARRDGPGHYVLNGSKIYITNAPEAGLFTVFATADPSLGARGVSAFVVEAGTPGLKIGRTIEMSAGRGSSHAEVILEDCRVPATNLLGGEGKGFEIAMRCLDAGRTHWGAYCVGAAQQLLDLAVARASSRETFGRRLREHQGIEWMLADMAAAVHGARLVAYEAAWRYDHGTPGERTRAAAMSKLIGADMVQRVADATLQIFGGAGYSKDLPIERIWRETRVVRILDGTSEMMRRIVARDLFREADRRNAPL
ncbi:MAG: acyl-CoA dehydrogenase family protein [Reyranella sp.]|jgi:acyl-CoA dehydrogenase|nr:acyl-CoA dehydrogenase family protein [Reyranella sp.]